MRSQHTTIGLAIGGIALIAFLAYSVIQYQNTGAATQGIITCAEGQCYWSAHMHTFVRMHQCRTRINLPKFTGPLSGPHTHAEENIVHWHDKLLADPETKNVIDTAPLLLGTALETLGVPIAHSCPGVERAEVRYFVNGEPLEEGLAYRWRDHDIIDIMVDDRSAQEAREYIQTLPMQFPTLGEE